MRAVERKGEVASVRNYCGCRRFPLIGRLTATEEDGLFPAAVIALPSPAWDRITPARVDVA